MRWNRGYVGSTYGEQNHPVLVELCRRHGRDLNFVGCIVFGGTTVTSAEKDASSSAVSKMARVLGADAALVVGLNGSNHAVDLMLTIQECEAPASRRRSSTTTSARVPRIRASSSPSPRPTRS